jgi:hypothetical protein
MDSAGWPVDAPRAYVLEIGPRRHRRLTLPSGLVLFLCMFLPAVNACGSSVYPTEMPLFWHPYVYGLALAIASCAWTVGAVRRAVTMMRVVACTAIAGGAVALLASTGLGAVLLVLGCVLLAMIGLRGASERRIASTGIVVSVMCLLWFGLWAGSAGALIGVYVSLAASIFLLAGSLLWLSEI